VAHDRFFPRPYRLLLPHHGLFALNRFRGAGFLGAQRFFQALRFAPLVLADRLMAWLLVTWLLAAGRSGGAAVCGRLLVPARTIAAMAPAASAVLVALTLRRPLLLLLRPRLVL
jgi:hypothetical protein